MAFKMNKKLTASGLVSDPAKNKIKNWIKSRAETGRFQDQLGEGQMESGIERLDDAQRLTRDEMYDAGYTEVTRLQKTVPSGMYNLESDLYFAEPTLFQRLRGGDEKHTNIHELAHAFERGTTNTRDFTKSNIEKAIENIPVKGSEEGYTTGDYMDPKELYAELMKFRIKNNIDPKKQFNKKDLRELRNKLKKEAEYGMFNINEMYDDSNILRLMNEVADSGQNTNLNSNLV